MSTPQQHSVSRAAEYWRNSAQAYREGRYLDSSRWARLAEYERDRAMKGQH